MGDLLVDERVFVVNAFFAGSLSAMRRAAAAMGLPDRKIVKGQVGWRIQVGPADQVPPDRFAVAMMAV